MAAIKLEGIGEIVSWTAPKVVSFMDLKNAVNGSGLDDKIVRDMCPANAFRRAIHHLEENRVIRKVLDADDKLHFQFTEEFLSGGEFHYRKECDLVLDKKSGVVFCTDSLLQAQAQGLVDIHIDTRTRSDVTRIVQKLFHDNGDLFPVRDAGGVYFVPERHAELSDRVEKMLMLIGGHFKRIDMANTERNEKNAAVMVRDSIHGMIADYRTYAEKLKSDDPKVMSKGMKRITEIRIKLDAYRDVLSGFDTSIESALAGITQDLVKMVTEGFEGGLYVNAEGAEVVA
jgi:hypothetical protein